MYIYSLMLLQLVGFPIDADSSSGLRGSGTALPQVHVRYFGEGVFGTLNRAKKLIFLLLISFFHKLWGH